MKAVVFFNSNRLTSLDMESIERTLRDYDIELIICSDRRSCSSETFDVVMTFGGDGTVLKAVPYALESSVPILSFKVGSVGFLSAFELHQINEALTAFRNSGLTADKRRLLQINTGFGIEYALNDFVLERSRPSRTISLGVEIEGFSPYNIAGDGIIISTPTGSTAYNLAAGGAIIDPISEVYQVTPLSPHNPYVGSVVVSATRSTTVRILDDRGYSIDCYIDGSLCREFRKGARINVSLSKKTITLLRPREFDFVGVMKKKLAFGGRLKDDIQKR
ncbi:NAD(+)/NADH kinase [Kosmotoga pacifica]|uniref:NAD(+)/NADH kinase n=1 Tax=Kosmotoga pacifica TaxID=1330330 RepID=UPI0006993043|nr:NAD(+)/NADH kinase [Kosmotoga pacifica]